jgi:hypothetical protein
VNADAGIRGKGNSRPTSQDRGTTTVDRQKTRSFDTELANARFGAPAQQELLPGGVKVSGDDDDMLGNVDSFLRTVAREILDRSPRAPAKGESYDLAAAQLVDMLAASYPGGARSEMSFGAWLRKVFGVPANIKTRDSFREFIVRVLTGTVVIELLKAVEALTPEEKNTRYTSDDSPSPAAAAIPFVLRNFEQVKNAVQLLCGQRTEVVRRPSAKGSLQPSGGPSIEAPDWKLWHARYIAAQAVARPIPRFPEIKATAADGRRVHFVLQEQYRRLFRPFNETVFERRVYRRGPLDQGQLLSQLALEQPTSKYAVLHNALANYDGDARLRTDVTDFSVHEMYEIKPRTGAHTAVLQVWHYINLYNCTAERFHVNPIMGPGVSWLPQHSLRTIPLGRWGRSLKYAIPYTIPGLPGLILYSVYVTPNEAEQEQARRVAQRAIEQEILERGVELILIVVVFTIALLIVSGGLYLYFAAPTTAALAEVVLLQAARAASPAVIENIHKAAVVTGLLWQATDRPQSTQQPL